MSPTNSFANRPERDAELGVTSRVRGCQPGCDCVHFGVGLREAHARRQPADCTHIAPVAPLTGAFGVEHGPYTNRQHNVRFVDGTEVRRQHSDDGEAAAIQIDGASNGISIATEV